MTPIIDLSVSQADRGSSDQSLQADRGSSDQSLQADRGSSDQSLVTHLDAFAVLSATTPYHKYSIDYIYT